MDISTNYPANVLTALTYEVVNGQPILYRGHQAVAQRQKPVAALRQPSALQQQFLSRLCFNLHADFGREYFIISKPDLRLQIDENHWRAIDIAITRKTTRKPLDSHLLNSPPEFVFLLDTKASLIDLRNPFSYYHQKASDLLDFGVQKVVWLFTEKQQLMLASASRNRWPLQDWHQTVELEPGLFWNCPVLIR